MKHDIFNYSNYFIIDAVACDFEIIKKLKELTNVVSLTDFSDESVFFDVLPYLVYLNSDNDNLFSLIESGFGNEWGIFIKSELDFENLKEKFYDLIFVLDENGDEYLFRIYDPSIFKNFISLADEKQLTEIFNGVDRFIIEDFDSRSFLSYSYKNKLIKETLLYL